MLAVLAGLLALSPAELGRKAAPGLSAIRPEAIAAHVRFLAADPARSSLSIAGSPALRPFEDYLPGADATRTEVEIEAPLVFVGYGVRAPELGYDDTAGVDLAGKIVVWLQGAPGAPF